MTYIIASTTTTTLLSLMVEVMVDLWIMMVAWKCQTNSRHNNNRVAKVVPVPMVAMLKQWHVDAVGER